MRRFIAAALISLPALVTGCLGEDWGLCDDEDNCMLLFRYTDDSGKDIFSRSIDRVDMIVFDENYYYVQQVRVDRHDLTDFQGVSLYMDPGVYHVVCWGNIEYGTDPYPSTIEDHVTVLDQQGGGLEVFYAPYVKPLTRSSSRTESDMDAYRITVPRTGTVERELEFLRAYRTINVFIKDYGQETDFRVSISNLAYSYDYMLRVDTERLDYSSLTIPVETPVGRIPGMKVNTPYQEIEDEINIEITTTDGRLVCPKINLKEHLDAQGVSLEALELQEINILVSFDGGKVEITVPDWSDNEVGPIW